MPRVWLRQPTALQALRLVRDQLGFRRGEGLRRPATRALRLALDSFMPRHSRFAACATLHCLELRSGFWSSWRGGRCVPSVFLVREPGNEQIGGLRLHALESLASNAEISLVISSIGAVGSVTAADGIAFS